MALAALALAAGTYALVENPVRRSSRLQNSPGRALAVGITTSAILCLLGAGWRSISTAAAEGPAQHQLTTARRDRTSLYETDCIVRLFGTSPAQASCLLGEPGGSRRIVLMGDSHAAHWVPALEKFALANNLALDPQIKTECPFPDVTAYVHPALARPYGECVKWRQAVLARVEQHPPALVIASSSYAYGPYGVTDDQWRDGMQRVLGRLRMHEIPVVVLRDVPRPGFAVPGCLARAAWRNGLHEEACAFEPYTPALERIAAIDRQEVQSAGGHFLDLGRRICLTVPCAAREGAIVKFYDSNHLTASYAQQLLPDLARALQPLLAATTLHGSDGPVTARDPGRGEVLGAHIP